MKFYTAQEVANILRVHQRTVTRWIHKGSLVGIKVGQQWRISHEDLEKFLQDRRTNRKD